MTQEKHNMHPHFRAARMNKTMAPTLCSGAPIRAAGELAAVVRQHLPSGTGDNFREVTNTKRCCDLRPRQA